MPKDVPRFCVDMIFWFGSVLVFRGLGIRTEALQAVFSDRVAQAAHADHEATQHRCAVPPEMGHKQQMKNLEFSSKSMVFMIDALYTLVYKGV